MSSLIEDAVCSASTNALHTIVVGALSELIKREMRSLATEQGQPGGDSDSSDDKQKVGLASIRTLTAIRADFEAVMTGAILE